MNWNIAKLIRATALDSKLAPRQLGRDAWGLLKSQSSAQGRQAAIACEHPLPTVAIGLDAGLLLGWRILRSKDKTNGR